MARKEIILRSATYGFFRQRFGRISTEDQNGDVRRGGEQLVERLDTMTVWQGQLEQDSVNSSLAQARKTLGKLANPFHLERSTAYRGERQANLIGSGRIIFN